MKQALFVIFLLSLLLSCSSTPKQEDIVAETAKQYYTYLLRNNYDAYVDGHYREDSIPHSYREQLKDNAKMFMAQQQTDHQGIKEIRITKSEVDTRKHAANAFLVLVYGDKTSEEIVVPMVEHNKIWYLR